MICKMELLSRAVEQLLICKHEQQLISVTFLLPASAATFAATTKGPCGGQIVAEQTCSARATNPFMVASARALQVLTA